MFSFPRAYFISTPWRLTREANVKCEITGANFMKAFVGVEEYINSFLTSALNVSFQFHKPAT
jgi:hypothetical protein